MQPFKRYAGDMAGESVAPGRLEQVRSFLNTWRIPNDTRTAVDDLEQRAGAERQWRRELPDVPVPAPGDLAALRGLRDDLRRALGTAHPDGLTERFAGLRLRAALQPHDAEHPVRLEPEHHSPASVLTALVVEAVSHGRWHRLRACPDCQWVFYDSSRNARRTWCSMEAGPDTRGCGSIAKTRAYRARRRRTPRPAAPERDPTH